MRCGESRKEATQRTLLNPKVTTKLGTWNVRTMSNGKENIIAKEMREYGLKILGLAETRWTQAGQTRLPTGELLLYSGHMQDQAHQTEGVALLLSAEAQKALRGWEPVNSRIITAKFNSSHKRIALNVIQCYAPTNDADEQAKDDFYSSLEETVRKCSLKDVNILMGDINAKVGGDNTGYEQFMGKHGLGKMNENGEMFANFCAEHYLVIGGTVFPHKKSHKATWVSPDLKTENQIDHICISKRFRRTMQDVRTRRGADAASDHHLVLGKLQLKLKRYNNEYLSVGNRFNVPRFKDHKVRTDYQLELSNRFQALRDNDGNEGLEEQWHKMKEAWTTTCHKTVGKSTRKHQDWISPETLEKVEFRREQKEKLNNSKTRAAKQAASVQYSKANREVKNSARRDKRAFVENLAQEAEEAAQKRNLKTLYDTTKLLAKKQNKATRPVKDKEGKTLTTAEGQMKRWVEHFKNLLNQEPPTDQSDIPPAEEPLNISCERPTKTEIKNAIKQMKNNKAPGPDDIPAEALKADIETSTDMLYELCGKIWEDDEIPNDWKAGHIIKLPKKGDLSKCENYRGIMLLSAPGKVLNRVLLQRLKSAVDTKLRDHQAGFRAERSCTDQIATLRIILEQSKEFNSPLYAVFIDFEKAFDSLDREVLWQLMKHYGIPEKIITIIRNTYRGMQCRVVHEGKLTESFEVTTGVRQGCLLSPFLFLLAVDWIMRKATEGKRNGIQWTLFEQLDDLDFADDISLLSHNHHQVQEKTTSVETTALQTGLRISIKKTKVLRANTPNQTPVEIQGQPLEEVDSFTYLGSVVDGNGGAERDVTSRISKARTAFFMLSNIWKEGKISLNTKLRLFNSNVKAVLLYGAETWKTTKGLVRKLQTFVNRCLRRIMNIRWPETITNEELWKRTKQTSIEGEIRKRKWGWIGHTLRKPANNITRQALQWNPQGKRRRGRPKNTWRRDTLAEMDRRGYRWQQLERLAQDRSKWRTVVSGLCSLEEPKAK